MKLKPIHSPLKQAIIWKNRLSLSKVINNLVRACFWGNVKFANFETFLRFKHHLLICCGISIVLFFVLFDVVQPKVTKIELASGQWLCDKIYWFANNANILKFMIWIELSQRFLESIWNFPYFCNFQSAGILSFQKRYTCPKKIFGASLLNPQLLLYCLGMSSQASYGFSRCLPFSLTQHHPLFTVFFYILMSLHPVWLYCPLTL
jgi:hypothetical protein